MSPRLRHAVEFIPRYEDARTLVMIDRQLHVREVQSECVDYLNKAVEHGLVRLTRRERMGCCSVSDRQQSNVGLRCYRLCSLSYAGRFHPLERLKVLSNCLKMVDNDGLVIYCEPVPEIKAWRRISVTIPLLV